MSRKYYVQAESSILETAKLFNRNDLVLFTHEKTIEKLSKQQSNLGMSDGLSFLSRLTRPRSTND